MLCNLTPHYHPVSVSLFLTQQYKGKVTTWWLVAKKIYLEHLNPEKSVRDQI
ncbi:hypothetical protein EXN66_Car006533 [Channa argus]|uniref:Uncharacterized protein n=1 Tax=Channa argus TaxID=215402 RepID=A0A6G1PKW0_CHAAH|nr:hypothetical protein EXN66_Car006533 [Channa argus]